MRVRAANDAGDGPWSAEVSETPFSPPDAPAGLNAQVTYRQVELSWNDPNNSDIESYQYRVSDDGGNNWDPDWTEIDGSGASTTSLTHSDLDHRTEYTFRVRAVVAGVSGEAASVTATPAATGVPHDWDLRPPGIATGETFRLLIVTSTWRNGESGDVDDYNDHVQDAVASGHADIQEYSSDFRALVGTRDGASPKDNTHSNPDSDGDGEQIWWLNGPRAANDYDDFYDGDWDHTNPVRLESGNSETFYQEDDSSQLNYHRAIWTGARADGSRAGRKHLGNDDGVSTYVGIPYRMDGPLRYRNWGWEPDRVLRLYGLSPVFRVEAPDAPYATTATITTEPANGTDYRAGEVVKATVTFSEDVTVTVTPQLPLRIGDEERDADYAAGDSSSTVLSFSYLVTDDDTDRDGISIDAFALKLNGGSIKRKDTNVDAALTHTRVLADDEQRVNLRPIITGVEVTSSPKADASNDTYGLGEDIEITVTFSEAVNVTGDVAFGFGVSGQREARLKSGNGTTELVFAYTVQSTDDDDGIWIGDHTHATNPTFDLEAGQSVVGADTGLDALLEHDKLGTLEDHKVDGSLTGADATLSALSLSGITLDQTFTAGAAGTAVTSFTATTSLSSTVVTATVSQSGGSSAVSITPADADANTTDHEVNLSLGDTVITVGVTSTNGNATRTYTVTVTRETATDTTAPSASSAQVSTDGMSIDIVFDEDLDATGSAPAALAFQVTVGTASAVNPSSVDFHATAATTVVLTMGTAIAAGETVSVAYTKPSANALADAASNEVESFTGQAALNRPAAPAVTLSAGDGKLTASWAAPANGGSAITGYDVEWKTAAQTWDEAATAGQSDTAAATATTHEITGLTNGIEHTVRVRAANDAGDGPWSAEASETPIVADTTRVVPSNWVLLPSGLSAGDEFRLLFVTSGGRNATSPDIAVYNQFVQDAAASGHPAIRPRSSVFRVLGSTEAVDARDNTGTTYTTDDLGVQIWWLGGSQTVDDYSDFYDGFWDHSDPVRNEHGNEVNYSSQQGVWTGSRADGVEFFDGQVSKALGSTDGFSLAGRPGGDAPICGCVRAASSSVLSLYGLSGVFVIGSEEANSDATLSDLTVDGTTVPSFDLATTEYELSAQSSTAQVTVAATASASDARIFYDPADADTFADGHQVDLPGAGATTVTVTVVAANGTGQDYTVVFEQPFTVEWSAPGYTAREGGPAVEVTLTVNRAQSGELSVPISVTTGGGAQSGDYSVPEMVTFAADSTTETFTVIAVNDLIYDGNDETLTLGFGELPSGVMAGTQANTTVSLLDNDIPPTSDLIPDGLVVGDEFRLLFVTSGTRTAESKDIDDYNEFVQAAAEDDGHSDIEGYSSLFRALASTESVSARSNTDTRYSSSNLGVPISWLGGPMAAGSYRDFYDGSWDHRDPGRDEGGDIVDFGAGDPVWTGTNADGTASSSPLGGVTGDSGRAAVSADPGNSDAGHEISGVNLARTVRGPLYGLSYVLQVALPDAPYVTGVEVTSSPQAATETYGLGEDIEFTVTFSGGRDRHRRRGVRFQPVRARQGRGAAGERQRHRRAGVRLHRAGHR